ncbi:hypothetical protein BGX38DRAFT_1142634 [Terfezia claveryi]|nr:hypothetical protein BGX38DRAFT_1142634 [Terfezia claveryi]
MRGVVDTVTELYPSLKISNVTAPRYRLMEPQVLMAIQGEDPASENAWGIQSGTNKGQEEPKRETEEEDELFIFRPLLSHLQLENLPELAISLRTALFGGDTCNPLTCTVSPRPMIGTYNILYRVTFSDSTEWLFKIPFIGNLPEWIEASGRKLRSEVNTMRFIRKYTKIPVPEVYAFDCHLDNLINAPYIAMEFINGITMLTKWFAKPGGYEQLSEEQLEERRVRWLKAVAEYMFELGKFRFDQCGMLDFKDGRDWPISIDPLRVPDMLAESQAEPSPDVVAQKYRDIGPFSDTKSYLLGLLYLQASNTSAIHLHRIL